jgi:hypothetical protein
MAPSKVMEPISAHQAHNALEQHAFAGGVGAAQQQVTCLLEHVPSSLSTAVPSKDFSMLDTSIILF